MNIGALDRRIEVEKPVSVANDFGELVATWTSYLDVWAAIDRKASAREASSSEQIVSFQSVTFIIRYSVAASVIEPSHRIKYNNKYYDILGVQEVGRNEQIRIVTELRDAE
jgi:SPP1 family predicted phage head-tail adaptor